MRFQETHRRSILKTLSWRVLATLTTITLVFVFTGKVKTAAAVGGVEVILKLILYFVHERMWNKLHWGKKQVSPFVLWFTGLPCSGKSTLADAVAEYLEKIGVKTERLDGDNVRKIFPGTGFSREERNNHIRRIGYLCSILEKNGVSSVTSFVSPYKESRDFVRRLTQNFIEVYVSTPLKECERRDVKGLYKKARRGEISQFTGIDDPYEVPTSPEITVNTYREDLNKSVKRIVSFLKRKKYV